MDSSIHERLSLVEENFLQAATQGLPALAAFQDDWAVLFRDVDHASHTQNINSETIALGNVVASRVATLSDYLLDFQTSANAMTSDLEGDLEAIFARVGVNDILNVSRPSGQSSRARSPTHTYISPSVCRPEASYVEPAYKWLLGNLHNPYPSKETRDAISLEAGSHRKEVDAWFIDVRKRIGWNFLRKQSFLNKRIDIADAAARFFVEADPKRPLHPNIESEFEAIENRAKSLYSEMLSASTSVVGIDVDAWDMAHEMKAREKASRRRRRTHKLLAKDQAELDARAASSYPSPDPSPSRSPEPSLPFLSEDNLATTYPEAISGHKRCSSTSDASDYDAYVGRLSKRPRLDVCSRPSLAIGLPSPAATLCDTLEIVDDHPSTPLSDVSDPPLVSTISTRKRRLSDADSQGIHKRPRRFNTAHRPHAVSDPLPRSSILIDTAPFEDWFPIHFELPDVNVEEPDTPLPLDIELFDFSTFASNARPGPSTATIASSEVHDPATSALLCSTGSQWSGPDISISDFHLDELFSTENLTGWSPGGDSVAVQDTRKHPVLTTFNPMHCHSDLSLSASEAPNLEFDLPFDSTESFPTPIQLVDDVVIADSLALLSTDLACDLDWIFPPITSSRDAHAPIDKLQDHGPNFPPEDNSPLLNPLTNVQGVDLAASTNDPSQLRAQANKTAKLRKLLEMKEATRRLEEEIAAS